MSKYKRYQDYVIRNGKLVGEFEEMYQDFSDPWEQTTREAFSSEKAIAINWCKKLALQHHKQLKVIELGCGLGLFTNELQRTGCNVLGLDISSTAIEKARASYPKTQFEVSDLLNYAAYEQFKPDVFIMAEITWYILEKLDPFLLYLKENFKDAYLIHLLTTYPKGVQQYGKDHFTTLQEIMAYFKLHYIEFGEITYAEMSNCNRTYFLAKL